MNNTNYIQGIEAGLNSIGMNGKWVADMLKEYEEYKATGLESEDILSNIKFLSNELNNALEKLAEYEGLEEQGLLMRLPCKPYVKVYKIYTKYNEKEDNYVRGIEELLLMRLGKNQYFEYAILKREDGEHSVTLEQFGKTVFLTREEAEKALEGVEK